MPGVSAGYVHMVFFVAGLIDLYRHLFQTLVDVKMTGWEY